MPGYPIDGMMSARKFLPLAALHSALVRASSTVFQPSSTVPSIIAALSTLAAASIRFQVAAMCWA
jgi:hypothetical protein